MIEKPQSDISTICMTFYDLSVSRNVFSKAEMRKFGTQRIDGLRDAGENRFCINLCPYLPLSPVKGPLAFFIRRVDSRWPTMVRWSSV